MEASTTTAAETFEQIERELGAGMVPRLFRLLEGRPALLAHLWGEFRALVLGGAVPRIVKEMLGLVVATHTRCEYVRVVHLHSLALQGLDAAAVEALRAGDYEAAALSGAPRDALRFALAAVAARSAAGGPVTIYDQHLAAAREALGSPRLTDDERLELLLTLSLFEQLCAVANLLALDPSQP